MKKTVRMILMFIIPVFMLLTFLPVLSKTLTAEEPDEQNVTDTPVASIAITPVSAIIEKDDVIAITVTVSPAEATDQDLVWSISGKGISLYSDQECSQQLPLNEKTSIRTVYAKAEAADNDATVTAASNADPTKSASAVFTDFIIADPEDRNVNYPAGTSFTVGVADESLVASYQWYMIDQKNQVFLMDGDTGDEATLAVPSSFQMDQYLRYYCEITDTAGKVHTSKAAVLDQLNRYSEDKPVFYVGEYAVEPGESLDLSTIDHGNDHPLGSGIVTFAENGTDVTLNNVHFDNTYSTAETLGGPNVALVFTLHDCPGGVFNLHLVGENEIVNHLEQVEWNLAGMPLDFMFWGNNTSDDIQVNIIGEGTLNIVHGTVCIRVIGNLNIESDINIGRYDDFYSDGIIAKNVRISGSKLNLDVNGAAIQSEGNLLIEDSDLTVHMLEPYVSAGASSKNGFVAHSNLVISNSTIDYTLKVSQDVTYEAAGVTGMFGKKVYLTDSSLSMKLQTSEDDEIGFAHHFTGLFGETVDLDHSVLGINFASPVVYMVAGLKGNEIAIHDDSSVMIDVHVGTGALGIYANGPVKIENSQVETDVSNLNRDLITPFAIAAREVNVDLNDDTAVIAKAHNLGNADAVAVAGMYGPYYLHDSENQLSYDAGKIILSADTIITKPTNSTIAVREVTIETGLSSNIETIVDPKTAKPATEAVITTAPVYTFLSGNGGVWTEGSGKTYLITVKRKPNDPTIRSHFIKLLVDDKEVDPDYYTLKEGSLIIELKPNFMEKLSIGKHQFTVIFDDGKISGSFDKAKKKDGGYTPPVTGID